MNRLWAAVLVGCGGAEFTSLERAIDVSDASGDASVSEASDGDGGGRDASPNLDAALDASLDGGTTADSRSDSSPICTSLTGGLFYCQGPGAGLNCADHSTEWCAGAGQGVSCPSIPSACRCVETYGCACVLANAGNPYPGKTPHGCSFDGGFVTVEYQ